MKRLKEWRKVEQQMAQRKELQQQLALPYGRAQFMVGASTFPHLVYLAEGEEAGDEGVRWLSS